MFLWPFKVFSIADSTSSKLRIVLASDRQSIRRGVQTKSVGKSVHCESMLEWGNYWWMGLVSKPHADSKVKSGSRTTTEISNFIIKNNKYWKINKKWIPRPTFFLTDKTGSFVVGGIFLAVEWPNFDQHNRIFWPNFLFLTVKFHSQRGMKTASASLFPNHPSWCRTFSYNKE